MHSSARLERCWRAGRQSILAEAEALRGEMREHVASLQRKLAATREQLAKAREQVGVLREWCDAYRAHQQARREVLALYRQRQLGGPGRSNSIR
jgi:hypothetical protein